MQWKWFLLQKCNEYDFYNKNLLKMILQQKYIKNDYTIKMHRK